MINVMTMCFLKKMIKQLLHLVSQVFPCSQIPTQYYALCMKYISLPATQHKPLYHLGNDKFSQFND